MSSTHGSRFSSMAEIGWCLRNPSSEINSKTYLQTESQLRATCARQTGNATGFANQYYNLDVAGPGDITLGKAFPLTVDNLSRTFSRQPHRLRALVLEYDPGLSKNVTANDTYETIKWMAECLGVSPYFFDGALRQIDDLTIELAPLATEGPQFHTLNGVYVTDITGSMTTTWFSHYLSSDFSLYIIHNPGKNLKDRIGKFVEMCLLDDHEISLPFLTMDSLILDDTNMFNVDYRTAYEDASRALSALRVDSDSSGAQLRSRRDADAAFSTMVQAYSSVYAISHSYGQKGRIVNLLRNIMQSRARLTRETPELFRCEGSPDDWSKVPPLTQTLFRNMQYMVAARQETIQTSLTLLTTVMNLKVATSSANIAADARVDSSSMSTIAYLTMVFLPGSFVASFFSTHFVRIMGDGSNDQPASNPRDSPMLFSRSTWIYWLTTVLLTVFVFLAWEWAHGSLQRRAVAICKSKLKAWLTDTPTQPASTVNSPAPPDMRRSTHDSLALVGRSFNDNKPSEEKGARVSHRIVDMHNVAPNSGPQVHAPNGVPST